MRPIIYIFIFLNYSQVYSQWPIDSLTGRVAISGIIEAKGKDKDKLHGILKSWAADYFRNSKYPLDVDDKEYGKIVYKGIINAQPQKYLGTVSDYGHFRFILKFWIKDEKVKYEFSNFSHESSSTSVIKSNCGNFENLECDSGVPIKIDKWKNMKHGLIKDINTDVEKLKKRINKDEFDF